MPSSQRAAIVTPQLWENASQRKVQPATPGESAWKTAIPLRKIYTYKHSRSHLMGSSLTGVMQPEKQNQASDFYDAPDSLSTVGIF